MSWNDDPMRWPDQQMNKKKDEIKVPEKAVHYERLAKHRLLYIDEFRSMLNDFMAEKISMSKLIEMINEKHLAALDKTLTSLLEELPEVNSQTCKDHAIGQGYYQSKIKSLIENKLK